MKTNHTTTNRKKTSTSDADLKMLRSLPRIKKAVSTLDEEALLSLQERINKALSERIVEIKKVNEDKLRKKALVDQMMNDFAEKGVSPTDIKTLLGC